MMCKSGNVPMCVMKGETRDLEIAKSRFSGRLSGGQCSGPFGSLVPLNGGVRMVLFNDRVLSFHCFSVSASAFCFALLSHRTARRMTVSSSLFKKKTIDAHREIP